MLSTCTFSSCFLLNKGCLVPSTSTRISIDTAAPWNIFVETNSEYGWFEEFCLKCFQGGQEMVLDEILIFKHGKPNECGWLKVRYLPHNAPTWFPSTDQMQGTDYFGD